MKINNFLIALALAVGFASVQVQASENESKTYGSWLSSAVYDAYNKAKSGYDSAKSSVSSALGSLQSATSSGAQQVREAAKGAGSYAKAAALTAAATTALTGLLYLGYTSEDLKNMVANVATKFASGATALVEADPALAAMGTQAAILGGGLGGLALKAEYDKKQRKKELNDMKNYGNEIKKKLREKINPEVEKCIKSLNDQDKTLITDIKNNVIGRGTINSFINDFYEKNTEIDDNLINRLIFPVKSMIRYDVNRYLGNDRGRIKMITDALDPW
jgi:hypothetical protein